MFAGSFMMGAKERLLPPSVPYRFFAAAVVFHLAAWALLLAAAPEALNFVGGQGLVLAALHMITLGVLAMTAMGAAIQLLPVATSRPLGPAWACRLMFWFYAPGVAVFAAGLGLGLTWAQHLGACLVVAGLVVFAILVAGNLRKVAALPGITRHTWLAVAALAALAVLGLLLVVDFTSAILPNRIGIAAGHAVLAGYGFMGMLAVGFSYVLIPMFVLGPAVPDAAARRTVLASASALVCGVGGAIAGIGPLAALGAVLGLATVGLHLYGMRGTIKARMRKRFEPFFRMVWVAWGLLPLSLLAAMALALGAPPNPWATLWGFLLVFGWLLTFVTGILQRVMPFLASMHSSGMGGKPAMLSQLTAQLPLKIHFICHVTALALMGAAILGDWVWPMRLGAAFGLAGAVSFVAFTVEVMRRYRSHLAIAAAATPKVG
jgi:hypothetical protein